ncbi:hypothetical protein ACKWTF_001909 [Chironomus riparius]
MPIKHSPKSKNIEEMPKSNEIECTPTTNNERKRKQDEEDESTDEELLNSAKNRKIDENDYEISLKDLMNELKANKVERKAESLSIRNDIAGLRGDVTQQINELKGSLDAVTTEVKDLKTKVSGIDARVDVVAKIANENRKMIGSYKQDKLEKFMEIDGLKTNTIDNTDDFKALAVETIKSFGINIDPAEIDHAFKKEINLKKKVNGSDKKKIVIVIFSNINTKIRVMKAKRDMPENTIYFNQSLTVANRSLIYKARNIVGKKLKVYFSRGSVRVQKQDTSEIIIDDETKLNEVQQYYDNIKNQQ